MRFEAVARLYAKIPAKDLHDTQFWMSRATALSIYETVTFPAGPIAGLDTVTMMLAPGGFTLFGIPIMFDDRMPAGKITAERKFGTVIHDVA